MFFDDKAWENYKKHVYEFDRQFTQTKRSPRAKEWRPQRFATRDQVIGMLVLRHQYKENIIEVDVFMTMDPPWIEGYSGTKMAALFILCDAYKCGSTMGIKFTKNVEEGTVPINIIALAETLDVELKNIDKGFITPKESRMLFIALTGFSVEAVKRMKELSISNLVTPERICYLVHHGIWSLEEMESILLGCDHPELILDGKIDIQDSLLYLDVFSRARKAIMGDFLDQKLKLKEVFEGEVFVDVEDNNRNFKINFDSRYFAKVYTTEEEMPIPWIAKKPDWIIPQGERLVVALRDYDWPDLHNNLNRDLEMCQQMIESYKDGVPTHFFILLTRDTFYSSFSSCFETYISELEKIGIDLMISPKLLTEFDDDVLKKIQQMSLVRHDMATGEAAKRENLVNKLPSDFNHEHLRFILVPREKEEGVVKLPQLVDQALYDEKELSLNVNRKNVENRHYRVLDRIAYLGKVALLSSRIIWKDFDGELLNRISLLLKNNRDQLRSSRLIKTIYPFHLLSEIINDIKNVQTLLPEAEELITFLKKAKKNEKSVIIVIDQHNKEEEEVIEKKIDDEKLENTFKGQFVPDRIIDYSDKSFYQVLEQTIWNAVNSTKVGRINSVSLGEVPHPVITQVLHTFSYRQIQDASFPISINIIYADGSQPKPFPLFRLKKRNNENLKEFRKLIPLKIGMLSCRHQELDSIIDSYWIRNIEMRMAGSTSAEKDEFVYQTTKERLAQIIEKNHPIRMNFYQTGFQPVVVGFYRAVVEFLMETQEGPPYLEVIPQIHDSRSKNNTATNYSWC
ncbi:MAG: hypothetical protein WCX20_00655 [Candidatus Shapirobacteria bacterium]